MWIGNFWRGRAHDLGKMTLGELVRVFFAYPAIVVYLGLAALALAVCVHLGGDPLRLLIAAAVSVAIYPLVWYLLHRFVLHGKYLYKSEATAALWKRIHFDHHQDPNDLRVLFAALHTSLPTIAAVTLPVGYAIGGWSAAALALAVGLMMTCFYEFCHCVQHLNYAPTLKVLKDMKWRHMAHHFHDEHGNFGITNFLWDRLFGTLYEKASDVKRSPTVFNLGYTEEEAQRYPYVKRLSGGRRLDKPPRGPASDADQRV